MKKLFVAWVFEIKRFYSFRNLCILLIFIALSLNSVVESKKEYQRSLEKKTDFLKINADSSKRVNNYIAYSFFGVDVIFVSSPATLFLSNPQRMKDVFGKVNSIFELNIFNNFKGPLFTENDPPFQLRFSSIILIFAVLAVMLFGYDATKNKEYLKFISSIVSPAGVYISIICIRILLIVVNFLSIFGILFLWISLSGIRFQLSDISGLCVFAVTAILMLIIFFFIGTIVGTLRKKKKALLSMVVIWLVSVFVFPYVIHSIMVKQNHQIISSFMLDSKKFRILMDFEEGLIKQKKDPKTNPREVNQKLDELYLKNEFLKLQALEEEYKNKIAAQIAVYNDLSLLTPTTFCILTSYEASSRGYTSYLNFFSYLKKLRYLFTRWWIDRIDYDTSTTIKQFVKKDENVFYAQSHVPGHFMVGIFLNVFYCCLLLGFSYYRFNRYLLHISQKESAALGTLSVAIKENKMNVFVVENGIFNNFLFALFSASPACIKKMGVKGQFHLGETDLLQEKTKQNFFFLCQIDDIPNEIKVKNLLVFIMKTVSFSSPGFTSFIEKNHLPAIVNKSFGQLTHIEKLTVLLAVLTIVKSEVVIINDLVPTKSHEGHYRFKKVLDDIENKHCIIFLQRHTVNHHITEEKVFIDDQGLYESDLMLIEHRRKYNEEKE